MSDEPIEISSVPCPNCGHAIPIGHSYCEGCGIGDPESTKNPPQTIRIQPPKSDPPTAPVTAPPQVFNDPGTTHTCPNCGHSIPNGTTYCANCGAGTRPNGQNSQAPQRIPTWVWILIIVLGIPLLCCGGCLLVTMMTSIPRS